MPVMMTIEAQARAICAAIETRKGAPNLTN